MDDRTIKLALLGDHEAAKRMTEATGCEAQTIHRMLELSGAPEDDKNVSFMRNEENPIDADVIIIDGSIPSLPKAESIMFAHLIPNIEWTIASNSGTKKKIPICLNSERLINFSSAPILRKIVYLSLLSELSANSFNAKIAAEDIRKIIPKYKPIKVTIAPRPLLESYTKVLVATDILSGKVIFSQLASILSYCSVESEL